MLSPFKKFLWKAKREQRKLKMLLPSITEEDDTFLKEMIIYVESAETDEKQEPDEKLEEEDHNMRRECEVVPDEIKGRTVVKPPSVTPLHHVKQMRGKAKVLESQWPCKWWQDEGKNRKIFNKYGFRSEGEKRFFRGKAGQLKIPRGREK